MNIQNLTGQKLGQYEIQEILGTGGMGAVYKGYQAALGRFVAVKVLSQTLTTDPQYLERFTREAKTYAALEQHPNIVPVYDFGTQDGISYVVMRLLAGGSLEERIEHSKETGRPLPTLAETVTILRQVGGALDYAHQQGVIHRDIKTNNIMFDEHGTAYVVDFGIAKLTHTTSALTGADMTMGTPSYMAPEQWKGETITQAADQYSLGIVTYAMLTGHLPFEGETVFELMQKHLNEKPTPLSLYRDDLPEEIREVIFRTLSKNQEDRYPSVMDYVNSFAEAVMKTTPADAPTGFFITPLPKKRIELAAIEMPIQPEASTPVRKPRNGRSTANATLAEPRIRTRLLWIVALVVLFIGLMGIFAVTQLIGGISDEDAAATETQVAFLAQPTATDTHTPTATDTETVTPSETPTRTASPTSTLTDTASPSPTATLDIPMVMPSRELMLRGGPGSNYPNLGSVQAGETLEITGISEDGSWFQVLLPDGTFGWLVSTGAFVDTLGPIQEVAIAQAPTSTPSDTPTATETATETPTPTPSVTPTRTLTPTETPSRTPSTTPSRTPTLTTTPSRTPRPTLTQRPTHTPSSTPTVLPTKTQTPTEPTPTPQATIFACPNTLPSQLSPGMRGIVLDDDVRPLNVRFGPGIENRIIDQLEINSTFEIESGPLCEDNFTWYQITYGENQTGWVAEGNFEFYFIGPQQTATPIPIRRPTNEPSPDAIPETAIPTLAERPNLPITPEAALLPTCEVLIGDNFERGFSRNDWFIGGGGLSSVRVADGAYEIAIHATDDRDPVSWGSLRGFEINRDMRIEAIIRADKFTPDEASRTGLWLRYQNENAFLAFMIRGDGYYRITNYQTAHTDLVPWTIAESLLVGDNIPNLLRIDVIGSRFDFYINGVFVNSVEDDTWDDGRIAFWGSPPTAPASFYLDLFRACER